MKKLFFIFLLTTFTFLVFTEPADCGGLLFAFPPELEGEIFPVARMSVVSSDTFVLITDKAEERSIAQTFLNDNEFPLESIYILPLPENVSETGVEVYLDGIPTQFTVMNEKEVKTLLRSILQKYGDHDLLDLWGERAIVVRPINIDSREEKTLKAHYKTSRESGKDVEVLKVTTSGERYSLGPVGDFSVRVKFRTDKSLRTSLSMTHQINVTRETPNRRLVSVNERNNRIYSDFELLTTFGGTDFNLRIINQEGTDSRNYFLLMLEPPLGRFDRQAHQSDLDVVFLVDSSGSLGHSRLTSAKSMVLSGIESLRESDRFNVMVFNSRVKKLSGKLMNATTGSKGQVPAFLDRTEPGGGSDLFNSILVALDSFRSRKRSGVIILLTDGRPTVGITNIDSLVENIRRLNKYKSRIYVVAVGNHPNIHAMEKLSNATGGKLVISSDEESAQAAITQLFRVMLGTGASDVAVEYSDLYPDETFPDLLPPMTGHETLYVIGNYEKSYFQKGKITAKAKIEGKVRTAMKTLVSGKFIEDVTQLDVLWAMRKFGKLLERELLKNLSQNAERVSVMSKNYGFINPLEHRGDNNYLGEDIWAFTNSFLTSKVISPDHKLVQGRLFRLSRGRWTDVSYKPNMPSINLVPFSKEFFEALEKNPELAKAFSVGPNVTVVKDGLAIMTTGS